MAKRRDWIFRLLVLVSLLLLVGGLTGAFLFQFRNVPALSGLQIPRLGLLEQNSILVPDLNQDVPQLADLGIILPSGQFYLPEGLNLGHVTIAWLVLLGLLLIIFARQRLVRNKSLRASVGCPSCQEQSLRRVQRGRLDRLRSFSTIPFARYRCADCDWEGLRVYKGDAHEGGSSSLLSVEAFSSETHGPARIPVIGLGDAMNGQTANGFKVYSPDAGSNPAGLNQSPSDDAKKGEITAPLSLNLREKPASDGAVLGLLVPGIMVSVLDNSIEAEGVTWQQVTVGGQTGWITSTFLKIRP